MAILHKTRILISFLIIAPFLQTFAQTETKLAQHDAISEFYSNYKKDDYKAMRKQMSWILRLILPTDAVRGMYEGDKMMFGEPELVEVKNISESSIYIKVRFSKDTTESMTMGYSFNKKNKIIGLRRSGEKMIFPKHENHQSLENRIAAVDSLFQTKKKSTTFSGCVMVIEDDHVVYSNCAGETDQITQHALNDSSIFELASCSKQFTAIAIMMLAEQGKLNLQDPITRFLPELSYDKVTIAQLLNHTGGIPDYMLLMDKKWDKSKVAFNQDLVAFFAKYKPKADFKPGEKHEYSNTGYALLSSIIEKSSGLSYTEFMKKNIFEPLGMDRSRVYNTRRSNPEKIENYAKGYVFDTKTKSYTLPDSLPDLNIVYWLDGITGDGTVNSCLIDLVKWENALRNHQLVSANTLQTALSKTKLNNGEDVNYGYGWFIQDDGKYQKVASHSGSWPGYLTMIIHFQEVNRSVVVLSNNEYYFIDKMGYKIGQIMCR